MPAWIPYKMLDSYHSDSVGYSLAIVFMNVLFWLRANWACCATLSVLPTNIRKRILTYLCLNTAFGVLWLAAVCLTHDSFEMTRAGYTFPHAYHHSADTNGVTMVAETFHLLCIAYIGMNRTMSTIGKRILGPCILWKFCLYFTLWYCNTHHAMRCV